MTKSEGLLSRLHAMAMRSELVRTWLEGGGLPRRVHQVVGLWLPICVLLANMWRVHRYTVDDSYISFRYARNLAHGLGLVYNPGEAVEGYTNFLWTVLLAGGYGVGLDPHLVSKSLGAAAAVATLVVMYRVAERMLPLSTLPCVATWLLASSAPFSAYAVFGLETSAFACLMVTGMWLMFREEEAAKDGATPDGGVFGGPVPWSGLVFALGGLTRPEAPMYLGLCMLTLGRGLFSRRNIMRGLLFAVPLGIHLLWRHAYYGAWLPATLGAKTGDLSQQLESGSEYLKSYLEHASPVVYFALFGWMIGIFARQRQVLATGAITVAVFAYVVLVGGDWMPYYRFLAPAEPFLFLLVGLGLRRIVQTHDAAAIAALVLFSVYAGWLRYHHLNEAQVQMGIKDRRFWQNTARQAADWLATRGRPGRVALGDIGYVGYRTNYPILDLLGLVDPVIGQLPGGYTRKVGKGFVERFYAVRPEYAVLILGGQNCELALLEGVKKIVDDHRFRDSYTLVHHIHVASEAGWCIFQRRDFNE